MATYLVINLIKVINNKFSRKMKNKMLVLLGGAFLICVTIVKNVDIVNKIICSVEALADGGDIGTPDFYLSKSHTQRFGHSEWSCQQRGLTSIPSDIRYTDLGGFPMVFNFCCEEYEDDYEGNSCHPYYVSQSEPQYSLNRENLCDLFTSGIWSYSDQKRR